MRLYSYFFIISIILTSLPSWACNKDIRILYGPFLTESFIQRTLQPVHLEIERLTHCQVKHHISPNYLLFKRKILQQTFDIILIASPHLPYIEPWHYKHVASGMGPIQISVLGKKDKNIFKIEDLEGQRLLLNGETSIVGLAWNNIAKGRINTKHVKVIYTVNTDRLLLGLFNDEAEAAVNFIQHYQRLPDNLKNKLTI